jgi:hypothetical protein
VQRGHSFQELIDRALAGMERAYPFLDDILVFSKSDDNQFRHLQETLEWIRLAGLTANAEKCEFNQPSTKFQGHTIFAAGIAPLPESVAAIAAYSCPTIIKELQNFLVVINFYRKFVPGVTVILCPLIDTQKGSPKPCQAVEWTRYRQDTFQAAKASLHKATHLAYPKAGVEISLMMDPSADHVGVALQQ